MPCCEGAWVPSVIRLDLDQELCDLESAPGSLKQSCLEQLRLSSRMVGLHG